jgi:uncharacterized membrane protein YkoI
MKTQRVIAKSTVILCLGLAASLFAGCASERDDDESEDRANKQAKLMGEAKISKEQAEQTAMAKVPTGTVKECELEKEHGKLIWSMGLSTPDTKNTTEVNVNAIDGTIVNVETETPESESKEKDND